MANDHSSKSPGTTLEAGRWLHNPATGEVAHVLSVDDEGRQIEVDLWLQPGAAVAGAHIHDHFVGLAQLLARKVDARATRGRTQEP